MSAIRASDKDKRLRDEIEKKHGKTPEQLYEEREKRLRDAIQLKQPDRVPVILRAGFFPAKYNGIPLSTAYYDPVAWKEANKKMIYEMEPDACQAGAQVSSGQAFEALDTKQLKWPGGTLPPDVPYQFVEGEYLKADEYDTFLADPSDFTLRTYLPRVYGALAPLGKLPPIRTLSGTTLTAITTLFASPEFQKLAKALAKSGEEHEKARQVMSTLEDELAALGFPLSSQFGGVAQAPFDLWSDYYRGMRESMIDMYRRPEKLLAACDKILEWRISQMVPADPKRRGNPKRIFMPLHRGAEGFMSKKQFETFYWPGLKKAIMANIDMGYVTMPFFEGRYGDRLEYLLELPKGKVVCHFEHMDMAHAKEVLGGHLCIMGNVSSSLLITGSVQEVEEYCKKLIKVCGKGGGFILSTGSSMDEAKPENAKAMIDSVKKYNVD